MKTSLILTALWLGLVTHASEPTTRTFYTGHSFAGAPANWLGILAQQAKIEGCEYLGR